MADRKYVPFANAVWRRPEDIADFLAEFFPPRCIEKGQSIEDASWDAAQVDLAQRIISTIRREAHLEE